MPPTYREADSLEDFDQREFSAPGYTHGPATKPVHWIGSGPGIIVIPEIPGLIPEVADAARRLAAAGFTCAVPSLFGTPGRAGSYSYVAQSFVKACVSKEFVAFARNTTSPVSEWLRALGHHVHQTCGGPGIGAIGMCLTGGFALGLLVEAPLVAGVLSQPSLPLPVPRARRELGLSVSDLQAAKARAADCTSPCILGLRFTADPLVPAARFARLREEFGDSFRGIEIDSSKGNAGGYARDAHSVTTLEYSDQPGTPTNDAWEQMITHFTERLLPSPTG